MDAQGQGAKVGLSVGVSNLTCRYGSFLAVDNVTIDIAAGEFLALLGPSGSGKTTILMSIAGFNQASSGSIEIAGRAVTHLPPRERNIGMVFQKYALFPHMTVSQNIAFPLIQRGFSRAETAEAVASFVKLVGLKGFEDRLVPNLSGGQQQRVALARALVYRPPVLLMDEPLGALDKKLRERLQVEIKEIQRITGTTVILVTHDQNEALNMADKLVVLDHGRIQQMGTPFDIYENPRSTFVADFIGEANVLTGVLASRNGSCGKVKLAGGKHELPGMVADEWAQGETPVADFVIRPNKLRFARDGEAGFCSGVVLSTAYSGDSTATHLELSGGGRLVVRETAAAPKRVGDHHAVTWDPGEARIFRNISTK